MALANTVRWRSMSGGNRSPTDCRRRTSGCRSGVSARRSRGARAQYRQRFAIVESHAFGVVRVRCRGFPCTAPGHRGRRGWPRRGRRAGAPSSPSPGPATASRRSPDTAYARIGIATRRAGDRRRSTARRVRRPFGAKPFGADRQTRCGTHEQHLRVDDDQDERGGSGPGRRDGGQDCSSTSASASERLRVSHLVHAERRAAPRRDDAHPRRPRGGGLSNPAARGRDTSRKIAVSAAARPASRPGTPGPSAAVGRVQHQHRRNDRQRRQRDHQRQGDQFGQHLVNVTSSARSGGGVAGAS